jgi:hydroxymethylbilane synthase
MPDLASLARPLRIGTRSSALALFQARLVESMLAARGYQSELVTYTTIGDQVLDRPLNAIGSKGLFTQELEDDLLAGRTDCAVHSLKDLPTENPPGLAIAALLPREDPRDALVLPLRTDVRVDASADALDVLMLLPSGARVGTSSLRRRAQIRVARPDLEVVELRGNVPTRVRKIDDGSCDAAILAGAGLKRLGLGHRIAAWFNAPRWLGAPGQGAIAVQVSLSDPSMMDRFRLLDDAPTRHAVEAERAMLGTLEGGCSVPIAAATMVNPQGGLTLLGLVASLDGQRVVRDELSVAPDAPAASGRALAELLRARGADEVLAALRS